MNYKSILKNAKTCYNISEASEFEEEYLPFARRAKNL
jgi:hypothetical protein